MFDVFDEAETDFLFDRIIYDVPWKGKSTVEHFRAESDYQLSEMEEEILQAMGKAYFSLFEVIGSVVGEYVQLTDLLSDNNEIELVDVSKSTSASKGLMLATRILEIQDIFMTTGAGYPFQAEQKDILISGLKARQTARRGRRKRNTSGR